MSRLYLDVGKLVNSVAKIVLLATLAPLLFGCDNNDNDGDSGNPNVSNVVFVIIPSDGICGVVRLTEKFPKFFA